MGTLNRWWGPSRFSMIHFAKAAIYTNLTLSLGVGLTLGLSAAANAAESAETNGSFLFGPFKSANGSNSSLERLGQAHENIQSSLRIRNLLRSQKHALSLVQRLEAHGIETTKFQGYYQGIEVIGAEALHHEGAAGFQVSDYLAAFDLNPEPTIGQAEAAAIARSLAGDRELERAPELKILPNTHDNSARLIYWMTLKDDPANAGEDLLMNAHTGEIIARISHHMDSRSVTGGRVRIGVRASGRTSAKPVAKPSLKSSVKTPVPSTGSVASIASVEVYEANSACQSIDQNGFPSNLDVQACTHTVKASSASAAADSAARNALNNAQKTLQYYQTNQGRNSYDGKGSPLVAIVHVGSNFNNAFWNPSLNIMAYGDGDGVKFGDFTQSLDVAGHEMTHGVVSNTAKLLYFGESGALNEAYADFFGKMIADDGDWVMGRALFINHSGQVGIRDLANPATLTFKNRDRAGNPVTTPYPVMLSEKLPKPATCDSRANDNCWVHINSTIPSHVSYEVYQAIGKAKAEKLYYVTLTQYLNATSTFLSARDATLKACAQLFDLSTCTQVASAYIQSGY